MYFSNAFLAQGSDSILVLGEPRKAPRWSTARDVRRAIERWQTKTFEYELRQRTESPSHYALEERMMEGLSGLSVQFDRPKLCDRMSARGSPVVTKYLLRTGKRDKNTQQWIDRLLALAPDAKSVLQYPIWRLLDPRPLDIEWHAIGMAHAYEVWDTRQHRLGAWMVRVAAGSSEEEEHYVTTSREMPRRLELAGLLLGLRRWEAPGDLVAYDLHLREALRIARVSDADESLAILQPEIADYIAHVFGSVRVPHGPRNLRAQADRVAAARAAWEDRVLVGAEPSSA